jgi:hypothetical protein
MTPNRRRHGRLRSSADPDAGARQALRLIGPDPQNWVPDRPGIDHNVVIVGGGQSGCALAFALRRAGIGRLSVIDMAPDEASAGVWLNAARMNVLRTPKTLPGPELGIPAFGFQAWYEARHGEPPMPRSSGSRAGIGPTISPGIAAFSRFRCATARG